MPTITIDVPTAVALRAKAVLDDQGNIGTAAEQLGMVKDLAVQHLIRWLMQGEADIRANAAQAGVTKPEIT